MSDCERFEYLRELEARFEKIFRMSIKSPDKLVSDRKNRETVPLRV